MLASVSTAFNVKPFTSASKWLFEIVMSLLSVTPLNVPPLVVVMNDEPSANAMVPPTTVPPSRFHEPVVASSVRVSPVLVSVPVTFTVPPVRVIVPMPAVVKEPSSSSVELSMFSVPVAFDHVALSIFRIPPLIASAVPLFVKVKLVVPIVSVCPETSAESVPSLISVLAELREMLPRPCTSISAPMVNVVAPPNPSCN